MECKRIGGRLRDYVQQWYELTTDKFASEKVRANNNEINYLEMRAAFLGLQAFCSKDHNIHVLLRLENATAVAYINNMGLKICFMQFHLAIGAPTEIFGLLPATFPEWKTK